MFARLFGAGLPTSDFQKTQDALTRADCVVIDVREAAEFRSGHVPGSRNMPLSRFDPSALPPDKSVILLCLSGVRSARAVRQARAAGRSDVSHYPGGVAGWRRSGGVLA